MKKRVTVHDIARIAGVSSATVSRVLSNSDYPVSKPVQEKVRQLAKELNYIPNMIGKQLKTDNNMTIGVIIPSISNPFYSAVLLGIEETARKRGYHVLLCNTLQNPNFEEEYLKTLFEKQVKGLILSSIASDKESLGRYIDMGLNVVAIDQLIDHPKVSQIEFDYRQGGYMATKYLLDQGHRKVAYVTAPLDRPSRTYIYEGYRDALREANIAENEAMVHIAENEDLTNEIYEFQNGKASASQLLARTERPTAVFACNDMTAFGIIHELSANGVRVPEDISVMGFDNIEFSQMIHPPLTTISQPDYEMGQKACSLLLERLEVRDRPVAKGDSIVLKPELVLRSSVRSL